MNFKVYFKTVLLMGFVIFLALLFNFLGLKETNPIISSLLFLATPLTTILFSAFFFKEKLSYKNLTKPNLKANKKPYHMMINPVLKN